MMLSVSKRVYIVDDRMINEYVAAVIMKISRKTKVLGEWQPECHVMHHKSHVT
jgi:hypothetical protein